MYLFVRNNFPHKQNNVIGYEKYIDKFVMFVINGSVDGG